MFCALLAKISGERLQDHWVSGIQIVAQMSSANYLMYIETFKTQV